jgi:hypothetical protein
MASFAADSEGNLFPATAAITDWTTLVTVVNANGGTLKETAAEAGITYGSYARVDTPPEDGVEDTYELVVTVPAVPREMSGSTIVVSPQGVFKQTTS